MVGFLEAGLAGLDATGGYQQRAFRRYKAVGKRRCLLASKISRPTQEAEGRHGDTQQNPLVY